MMVTKIGQIKNRMKNKLTIVMYHYVRDTYNSRFPNINALQISQFEEQIKYLKKYYYFPSYEELVNCITNKVDLPKNSCLLTFDDGYADHYQNVFPTLLNNKLPGYFFPPAKPIQENVVLGVNKIHFILDKMTNQINDLIENIFEFLDKNRIEYDLKNNNYYFNKCAKPNRYDTKKVVFVKSMLQYELPHNLRSIIIDRLFSKFVTKDESSFSEYLYLNINQIKTMINEGMYFGSHGYQHFWLNKVSRDEQELDIIKSLKFLRKINSPTKNWIMCYPYGGYNDSTVNIIESLGSIIGFTSKPGISKISDRYNLKRLDTNDFPKTSKAKMNKWTKEILQ